MKESLNIYFGQDSSLMFRIVVCSWKEITFVSLLLWLSISLVVALMSSPFGGCNGWYGRHIYHHCILSYHWSCWSIIQWQIASLALYDAGLKIVILNKWPWCHLPLVFIKVFSFLCLWIWSGFVCVLPCMAAGGDGKMICSVSMSPSQRYGGWALQRPSGPTGRAQTGVLAGRVSLQFR